MTSLARLVEQFDPGEPFEAPAYWLQGGTVFNGLSAALSLQAILHRSAAGLPPLKSAQVTFISPVTQAQTFNSRVFRHRRSEVSVTVDCMSGDDLALRTTMLFAEPRVRQATLEPLECRSYKVPSHCQVQEVDRQVVTACGCHFEMRPAGGSLPVSGAENSELLMWVRHQDAQGVDPAVALIALVDSLLLADTNAFIDPAAITSASWTIDLLQPAADGQWFLINAFNQQAREGYSMQDMEIWNESGQRVLWARQIVAMLT